MKRKVVLTITLLVFILQITRCQVTDYDKYQGSYPKPLDDGITQPVSVLIIYDNYVHTSGMESDWGYSILIKGLDKTILFDTGTKPKIFESNFKKLGIKKCGATHCTGEDQIKQFRKAFGENFVDLGVGNTLVIN